MDDTDAKSWTKYLNNSELNQVGYDPEHPNCGTDDCCQQCDTADTTPQYQYTQRDWDRTVGWGKVPKKYEKKSK